MASSIQAVGSRHEILDDLDLLVFLGLVLEEIQAHPDRYSELAELSDVWLTSRTTSGPGTIDLKLERVLKNEASLRQFRSILSTVEARAGALGPVIPAR